MMSDEKLISQLKLAAEELREANPECSIYLLVNPHRPIPKDDALYLKNIWVPDDAEHRAVVKRPDFDWKPEVCPWLLKLANPGKHLPLYEMDEVYRQAIAEAGHSNGAYICGIIASTSSITTIARNLASKLRLPRSLSVCPLFEPLRLERLLYSADTDWLKQWFDPIKAWLWVGAEGRPLLWQGEQSDIDIDIDVPLNQQAIQAQSRIVDLQRCLTSLKNISDNILPANAAQRADQCLVRAEDIGLISLDDKIYFALLSLAFNDRWHEQAEAQSAILKAKKQPGSLVDAIESLPEASLQILGLLSKTPEIQSPAQENI